MLIMDYKTDSMFHYVNLKQKKYVGQFGAKEQGLGEFLLVSAVYPDMTNRPLLFDVSKK